jgi:hypothetical protein
LKNNKFNINIEREDPNKNTLNLTNAKQKLNLLSNKTSRENANANSNLKNNLSPNHLVNDFINNKKVQFHETINDKKDKTDVLPVKKTLNSKNDMNISFQYNNERIYINQKLKPRNVIINKSNILRPKITSKSTDKSHEFNSNKLYPRNAKNINNHYSKVIINNNKQKSTLNTSMNNKTNFNLNKKIADSNIQLQNQKAPSDIGKNVFSLNVKLLFIYLQLFVFYFIFPYKFKNKNYQKFNFTFNQN